MYHSVTCSNVWSVNIIVYFAQSLALSFRSAREHIESGICCHISWQLLCFVSDVNSSVGPHLVVFPSWRLLRVINPLLQIFFFFLFHLSFCCLLKNVCIPNRSLWIVWTFSCCLLTWAHSDILQGVGRKSSGRMSRATDSDICILTCSPTLGNFQENVQTSLHVWKQLKSKLTLETTSFFYRIV